MNGEDAKERIHFLSEEINFHNNLYYNEDNPVIEDYEYDRLLSELENLEKYESSEPPADDGEI